MCVLEGNFPVCLFFFTTLLFHWVPVKLLSGVMLSSSSHGETYSCCKKHFWKNEIK